MRKPKVGEKLWIVSGSEYALSEDDKMSGEICSVISSGRKYFKCLLQSWNGELTFHINTWRQKTKYSPDYILYESKQIWEDEVECTRYWDIFRDFFQYGAYREYTLQQLKDVAKILNITLEKNK